MNMTINVTPTSPVPIDEAKFDKFEQELKRVVNSLSMEIYCELPDYVIAKYLRKSFENLSSAQTTGADFFRI